MESININKIVVATDLSKASSATYAFVAGIATVFQAEILLLYVDELSLIPLKGSQHINEYMKKAAAHKQDRLNQDKKWFESFGIPVKIQIETGAASEKIQNYMNDADLLVVAQHGVRGLEKRLWGSTSKRVVFSSVVPVLVVPPRGPTRKKPFIIQKILTTTDFSPASQKGLKAVSAFAAVMDATITLAHVNHLPAPTGLPKDVDKFYTEKLETMLNSETKEKLEKEISGVISERMIMPLVLSAQGVGNAIAKAAKNKADLIMIPSHGMGSAQAIGFGSTTDSVVRRTDKPVMVFPRVYLEKYFSV